MATDFNVTNLQEKLDIMFRRKNRVSIDECARLCISETSFDCQSLSYLKDIQECKWSSLAFLSDNITELYAAAIPSNESDIYISNN